MFHVLQNAIADLQISIHMAAYFSTYKSLKDETGIFEGY